MSSPFINVWCQPSYAKGRVIVDWTLASGFDDHSVIVARSASGTPPWEVLNAASPVAAAGNFEDSEFVVDNRIQLTHYQLALQSPTGELVAKSPVVNLLGALSKSRYGVARYQIRQEVRQMRAGDGNLMWHFQPLPGQYPGGTKNDTGQTIGVECPQSGLAGFAPPVQTYVMKGTPERTSQVDNPEGQGYTEDVMYQARMLAFPKPSRGHVLVDPFSDDRFVVGGVVEAYRIFGVVAVAYGVTLSLLNRDDERYRLLVPPLS
jgi:hypothetical protein